MRSAEPIRYSAVDRGRRRSGRCASARGTRRRSTARGWCRRVRARRDGGSRSRARRGRSAPRPGTRRRARRSCAVSTRLFIFITMRPWRAERGLRRDALAQRVAQVRGRDQQLAVVALVAVAGEVVEQVGEVVRRGRGRRRTARCPRRGARSSGCSCRCRRGSSAGCRRAPGARRAAPWRGSSARRARTRRARRLLPARVHARCWPPRRSAPVSSTSVTHLLALLGGLDQRAHDRALGAGGAVDGLLDREHARDRWPPARRTARPRW